MDFCGTIRAPKIEETMNEGRKVFFAQSKSRGQTSARQSLAGELGGNSTNVCSKSNVYLKRKERERERSVVVARPGLRSLKLNRILEVLSFTECVLRHRRPVDPPTPT